MLHIQGSSSEVGKISPKILLLMFWTDSGLFGDGASEAGRRKDWATQLEGEAACRRQAQEVSRRQLRGIVRHGYGLL